MSVSEEREEEWKKEGTKEERKEKEGWKKEGREKEGRMCSLELENSRTTSREGKTENLIRERGNNVG